jgi:hypothetical protein
MFRGEIQRTPDQALPFRAVVWSRGELTRARPAASQDEARRVLIRLLAEAREATA